MKYFYSAERNVQIVIYLLKENNIKYVVASPGSANTCMVASLQHDPFFHIFSAPDERSAGYIACGLAAETGESVVLSCTGATASRNYMPALTEAYYRQLPVLAITSSRRTSYIGHNIDQVTDRTLLPRDVAKLSVQMPIVHDKESEWECAIAANKAILELNHHGSGPVHINLITDYNTDYSVQEIAPVQTIKRLQKGDELPVLQKDKVAILVGSHLKWTSRLTNAVECFCERYNAVVVCDQISNYKGKYRIFPSLVTQQRYYNSVIRSANLIIDIGYISASKYGIEADEVWRINPDGEIRDKYKKLRYIFEMTEEEFFEFYVAGKILPVQTTFWNECLSEANRIKSTVDNVVHKLPFSNIWIASQMANKLPANSVLHLGIQNSLRSWNYFDTPKEVLGYSNTGGYGIDGSLSSTIGASFIDQECIYFCVLGDLAFFYDMNSLGNRHIGKNVRILLINNGKGVEFKIDTCPAARFGSETDLFIAAEGHYGKKSSALVRHYAKDLGFEYCSASTKEEYMSVVEKFISPKFFGKPIIFEVFIDDKDDVKALTMIRNVIVDGEIVSKRKKKDVIKNILGERGTNIVKSILKKD